MTAWTHDQPADQATFGNDSVTESLIPTIAVTDSTGKVTLLRIDVKKIKDCVLLFQEHRIHLELLWNLGIKGVGKEH